MNNIRAAVFLTLALWSGDVALAQDAQSVRREGALIFDGIPTEPVIDDERLRRFAMARTAFFEDWLADGSMLVLTNFGSVYQVHRVRSPGGARTQLTFAEEPISSVVAQPDSDRFLFARDVGGNETYQGFLGRGGADAVKVTEDGTRNQDFIFSRDGRLLVWSRLTPGHADADIMMLNVGDPGSRRAIFRGTGTVTPIDINKDGTKILVEQRESIVRNQYLLVDTTIGASTRLLPERDEAAFRNGRFLPDGSIALTLIEDDGFRALALLDTQSGQVDYLARDGKWDVELFDLAPDGRRIAYSVNEDGFSRVTIFDRDRPEVRRAIEIPDGQVFRLRFSPDGARLAIGMSTARGGDVWSWDGAELSRWTFSELGGLSEDELSQPQLVRFPTFDGRTVPAFVYRPTVRASAPRPVIISIHGGPEAQERTWFNPEYQYWTSELGAVVIAPNVRGSTGYGLEYLALDDGMKREGAVRDIGALLDWIETQPDLDASRVVVYGESYGGFMALASLARYSERLAGAIDVVGISNFTTFLENTEGYRRDRRRAEYGDERDPAMRAFFERISPLNRTAQMTKPLLVVAGANDIRVPLSESRAIVSKVRELGGEAWLLVAENEGHGFHRRENRIAKARVETRFLKRVFGGGASEDEAAK